MAPLFEMSFFTFLISIQLASSSLCGNLVINCNKGATNCYSGPCASFAAHFTGHNHLPKALYTFSPTNAPTATPTKLPTPRFIPYNRVLPYNKLPNSVSTHEAVSNPTNFATNTLSTNSNNQIPSATNDPTFRPTSTLYPASKPTMSLNVDISSTNLSPTIKPTFYPTLRPTSDPTLKPTPKPTLRPTTKPTLRPIAIVNQVQGSSSDEETDLSLFFMQNQAVSAITNDQTSCSIPGEQCSFVVPREERCCGELGGSTRCKPTERDSNGYYIGYCCVKYGQMGCKYDDDCCRSSDACVDFVCKTNTNGVQYFDHNFDNLDLIKRGANDSEKRAIWFPANIWFVVILMSILPVLYCVWYKYYLAKQLEIYEGEACNVEEIHLAEDDADDEKDSD